MISQRIVNFIARSETFYSRLCPVHLGQHSFYPDLLLLAESGERFTIFLPDPKVLWTHQVYSDSKNMVSRMAMDQYRGAG